MGSQPVLREIIRIQRHYEVSFPRLRAATKWFIPRIGRDVVAGCVGDFFSVGADQIDDCSDEARAHAAARKNRLIFIENFLVDQPGKRVVVDPVTQ